MDAVCDGSINCLNGVDEEGCDGDGRFYCVERDENDPTAKLFVPKDKVSIWVCAFSYEKVGSLLQPFARSGNGIDYTSMRWDDGLFIDRMKNTIQANLAKTKK